MLVLPRARHVTASCATTPCSLLSLNCCPPCNRQVSACVVSGAIFYSCNGDSIHPQGFVSICQISHFWTSGPGCLLGCLEASPISSPGDRCKPLASLSNSWLGFSTVSLGQLNIPVRNLFNNIRTHWSLLLLASSLQDTNFSSF